MRTKNKIYFLLLGILSVFFLFSFYQVYTEAEALKIVFLDVGQGDSILIQKGTKQILIDGGPSGKKELAQIGKYVPYFDREIEIVIITHPDKDHIAGLIDVARNYKIGEVLSTAAEKDTQAFREWKEVLNYNKIGMAEVSRGTRIEFDEIRMKILNPAVKVEVGAGESNSASVVARLDYGENSFLFTGDIEANTEAEILSLGENLDADVLKVAHHGSRYSSSDGFLDAVSPEEAIISASKDNTYGHPHEETLARLRSRNIAILGTYEKGDIIFKCENQNSKCRIEI